MDYTTCPYCAKDSAGKHENGCPNQNVEKVDASGYMLPLFGQTGWICPVCQRVMSPNYPVCWYCSGSQETITTGGTGPLDVSSPPSQTPPFVSQRWGRLFDARELIQKSRAHLEWMLKTLDFYNEHNVLGLPGMVKEDSPEMKEARETLSDLIDEIASWKE